MKRGYTLIELLVGISVISIVFLIGYASFREFSRRQALTGVVRRTIADLRLAQQMAITGEKPSGCVSLDGYLFIPNSDGYKVSAKCQIDFVIKDVQFDSEISLSGNLLLFKVLGQGTNLNSDIEYKLTHESTGNEVIINIGKNGEIK